MKERLKALATGNHFLYLLLFFFVLHGCTDNFPLVSFSEALILFGQYVLVTAALYMLCYLLFRSAYKAAFFAFFLLSFQFLFGAVHDFLKTNLPNSFLVKYVFLLPFTAAVFTWLFFFLRRTSYSLSGARVYLNGVLLLLIFIDGVLLLYKSARERPAQATASNFIYEGHKPNIYLIVADEYAGREELKDVFHFDNSAFEKNLARRGFQVLTGPRSNYNYTPFSMASLFQMDYLKGISPIANDFENRKLVFSQVNRNSVATLLRQLGYKFVNNSVFDFAGVPAERNGTQFFFTGRRIISSQTFTSRIKRDLWYHLIIDLKWNWFERDMYNGLREDIHSHYERTVGAAKETSRQPRFVYTHFEMPHYPYLYNENGLERSLTEVMNLTNDNYLGYLKYANKLLLELVDTITQNDKSKPMIVLMSDHGYREYSDTMNRKYNFTNMVNVYGAGKLPDSITTVNLFRLLLNQQFKTSFPLLKDSTVFLHEE